MKILLFLGLIVCGWAVGASGASKPPFLLMGISQENNQRLWNSPSITPRKQSSVVTANTVNAIRDRSQSEGSLVQKHRAYYEGLTQLGQNTSAAKPKLSKPASH